MRRGGVQPLIQRLERQRPPPLGLGPRPAGHAPALVVLLLLVAVPVARRERAADPHGDQGVEHGGADGRDGRLRGGGEELGEGEGLGRVAAEGGGLVGRVEVGEDGLVEAEVGPRGQEAVRGQEERGGREQGREG